MAGKLRAAGTSFTEDQVAAVILANAEWAAVQTWGREMKTAVETIRRRYPCGHRHNAASVAKILANLAKGDAVRNRHAASAPEEQAKAALDVERLGGRQKDGQSGRRLRPPCCACP